MPKITKTKKIREKTVRIRDDLHELIEKKAKHEDKYITEILNMIVANYFAAGQVDLLSVTIEDKLMNRLERFEKRLAGMWGKQGMHVSMILVAAYTILSRAIQSETNKDVDIDTLIKTMRPLAVRYFQDNSGNKPEPPERQEEVI